MKTIKNYRMPAILLLGFFLKFTSCKESFLNVPPAGKLSTQQLLSAEGADLALNSAYNILKGDRFYGTFTGWVFGGVTGQEAYKGYDSGDQGAIIPLFNFSASATNEFTEKMWKVCYNGIGRANSVLKLVKQIPAGGISEEDSKRITGEAGFLRGFYHFAAIKHFRLVPFINENADYNADNYLAANDREIWPEIIADFQYATDNLPAIALEIGRANKWAAKAFLGKTYLFAKKYDQAYETLSDVVANGVNSKGEKHNLNEKIRDAFEVTNENSAESVFSRQASVNDGSGDDVNANDDQVLNYTWNFSLPVNCCGFYQPSLDQANAFRTKDGLPLPDGSYNSAANELADVALARPNPPTPIVPDNKPLDPRIDWVVGRNGIPFLDLGNYASSWVRNLAEGGPYSQKRYMMIKEQAKTYVDKGWVGWTSLNYYLMRFSDVLLMAAEAAVEKTGTDLEYTRTQVNRVRIRAANLNGFVRIATKESGKTDWDAYQDASGTPAGNYQINNYANFPDQAYSQKAVHMERYLELAMEGHRFFDLVRWDETTNANKNGTPITLESAYRYNGTYFSQSGFGKEFHFKKGQHEYFPILQAQIDLMRGALKQNEYLGKQYFLT